jgi:hypothetical protein
MKTISEMSTKLPLAIVEIILSYVNIYKKRGQYVRLLELHKFDLLHHMIIHQINSVYTMVLNDGKLLTRKTLQKNVHQQIIVYNYDNELFYLNPMDYN